MLPLSFTISSSDVCTAATAEEDGWWCQEVRDSNALSSSAADETLFGQRETEEEEEEEKDRGQSDRSADKHAGPAGRGLENRGSNTPYLEIEEVTNPSNQETNNAMALMQSDEMEN